MGQTSMELPEIRFTYRTGRCANGFERDGGTIIHAVPRHSDRALCGVRPGRRSAGWSENWDCYSQATCPRCLKKLA